MVRYNYAGKVVKLNYEDGVYIIPKGTEVPVWTGTLKGKNNEPNNLKELRKKVVHNGVLIRDVEFRYPASAASFLYGKRAPATAIEFVDCVDDTDDYIVNISYDELIKVLDSNKSLRGKILKHYLCEILDNI